MSISGRLRWAKSVGIPIIKTIDGKRYGYENSTWDKNNAKSLADYARTRYKSARIIKRKSLKTKGKTLYLIYVYGPKWK